MSIATYNAQDFVAMQQHLSKRNFEQSLLIVIENIRQDLELTRSKEFQSLFKRAFVILKTRCSDQDTAFWQRGLELATLTSSAASLHGTAFENEVTKAKNECHEILGPEPPSNESSEYNSSTNNSSITYRNSSLFEGQLTEDHQRNSTQRAVDDVPIAADLAAMLFNINPALLQQQQDSTPDQTSSGNSGGNTTRQDLPQQQQPQQQGIHAAMSPEITEAIQRELDAIALSIMEETGQQAALQQRAPPASKRVVASLHKEIVTDEKLQQLGGSEARCPICMNLEEGDEIIVMPCKHYAHTACLKPWLEQTNSCPTCRFALTTDDIKYEERKEREKREEEERKGAMNAVKNDEFLYI